MLSSFVCFTLTEVVVVDRISLLADVSSIRKKLGIGKSFLIVFFKLEPDRNTLTETKLGGLGWLTCKLYLLTKPETELKVLSRLEIFSARSADYAIIYLLNY